MNETKIQRNIEFLKTIQLPLSEKLDKVISPGLVLSNRLKFKYTSDGDTKEPINRPKL